MLKIWGCVLLFLLSPLLSEQNYFEKNIQEFEKNDQKIFPPLDGVLFIGSSSIRLWKSLPDDFPEWKTINRGFGGSQTSDVLYFIDRIVFPYHPATIFFYCGENDIAGGKKEEIPLKDFQKFVTLVHAKLPQTTIYYLSMKPSPLRWHLWPQMNRANQSIHEYCKKYPSLNKKNKNKNLYFIDIAKPMLNLEKKPKEDIFISDQLHMNEKGYFIWCNTIKEEMSFKTGKVLDEKN